MAEIVEEFDWLRVYKTMELLDWEWGDLKEGTYELPSIGRLMIEAHRLLSNAWSTKCCQITSGGFRSYYYEKDNTLALEFILSSWTFAGEDVIPTAITK